MGTPKTRAKAREEEAGEGAGRLSSPSQPRAQRRRSILTEEVLESVVLQTDVLSQQKTVGNPQAPPSSKSIPIDEGYDPKRAFVEGANTRGAISHDGRRGVGRETRRRVLDLESINGSFEIMGDEFHEPSPKREDRVDVAVVQSYQPKKLPNMVPLCISNEEKRTRDLARWFENFERELIDLGVPESRWISCLSLNVEHQTQPIIDDYISNIRNCGGSVQDGREILRSIADAVMMRFFIAHHPGAYLCRHFCSKSFFNKSAREAYTMVHTLKKRFNDSVGRLNWAGYKAESLSEHMYAYFYLTALSENTTQQIRDKLPKALKSQNPLQYLAKLAFAVEREAAFRTPFDEQSYWKPGSGEVSVGYIRAGTTTPEPKREENWGRREVKKEGSWNRGEPRREEKWGKPVAQTQGPRIPWEDLQCMHCGKWGHREETCRAWKVYQGALLPGTCAKCLKRGHDSSRCKEKEGVAWVPIQYRLRRSSYQNNVVGIIQAPINNSNPPEDIGEGSEDKIKRKQQNNPRGVKRRRRIKISEANNPNGTPLGYIGNIQEEKPLGDIQVTNDQRGGHILMTNGRDSVATKEGREVRFLQARPDRRIMITNNTINRKLKGWNYMEEDELSEVSDSPDPDLLAELVSIVRESDAKPKTILNINKKNPKSIVATLRFEDKVYEAVFDTGCPYTLIRQEIAREWEIRGNFSTVEPHIYRLADVNGRELKFNRSIEMYMEVRGENKQFESTQTKFKLGIVEYLPVDFLLGMDMITAMRFTIDLSTWDRQPDNVLWARDFKMFKSPITDIQLYRTTKRENILVEEKDGEEIGRMFRTTLLVEDLTTTCMSVSAWARTIGRDKNTKDEVLRKATMRELKQRQMKTLKERSLNSYCELQKAIFHDQPTSWSTEQREVFFRLCLEFPTIWNSGDIPLTSTSLALCHLEVEGNPRPIKAAVRPMSEKKKEITRIKINELMNEGIITISESTWASPVVLVPKTNNEWRLCIDYRELNKVLKVTSWPLPRMHQVSDRMQGIRFVCALDLLQGYYQIELTEECQHLTAFQTTEGLFSIRDFLLGSQWPQRFSSIS